MNSDATISRYFNAAVGLTLDDLLAPIREEGPAGPWLRTNGVYRDIKEARRQDDPTLPQGAWTHDLKKADWEQVAQLAAAALADRSKDLQLAIWLLEAEVNRGRFKGMTACVELIGLLCEHYWDTLHPNADDGDLEHRMNVLRWMNDKLLPVLRMIPLTAADRNGKEYTWADWELARRNEQLRAAQGNRNEPIEGVTANELGSAMSATATERLMGTYNEIREAMEAVGALNRLLDQQAAEQAPSMTALTGLLDSIMNMIAAELHKRGAVLELTADIGASVELEDEEEPAAVPHGGSSYGLPQQAILGSRADAYARLAEAAEFLAHIEPHSPVPYLVRRALEWGQLNTAELYHELFIVHSGQLNIFDLLGLQAMQQEETAE